jgi:hypothetical protein
MLPPICHVRLPRGGLANNLIIWARGRVFAELNALPIAVSGWFTPRIGPWLRREERKRLYMRDFRVTSPVALAHARALALLGSVEIEPPVERVRTARDTSYVFNKLPREHLYFRDIRDHRDLVRRELARYVAPRLMRQVESAARPVIALHIRRGDFREVPAGKELRTDFGRTPLSYFVRCVEQLRGAAGKTLPATIFSDGRDDELRDLLALPAVQRAPWRPDIVDMMVLSRSKLIVGSAWSTFSMLAAFLSDAPMIDYPTITSAPIRSDALRAKLYEGPLDEDPAAWPDLLRQNLAAIARSGHNG